jgi:pimeloyl-ACP methyl ester carboxylesterase
MQTHYAYRVLATQLAHAGSSVLRFDWSGTGDSAGDSGSVTFQHCRDDLQMAVQELKDISNARRISVVGFRLGATIAATTPFKRPLEELVLWEPVIRGHDYLEELQARERRKFGDLLEPPSWWRRGRAHELLGYAMSSAHHAEIEALDLTMNATPSARHTVLVAAKVTAQQQMLVASLKERGIETSIDDFEDDEGARLHDNGMLLAGATIAKITGMFKGL